MSGGEPSALDYQGAVQQWWEVLGDPERGGTGRGPVLGDAAGDFGCFRTEVPDDAGRGRAGCGAVLQAGVGDAGGAVPGDLGLDVSVIGASICKTCYVR